MAEPFVRLPTLLIGSNCVQQSHLDRLPPDSLQVVVLLCVHIAAAAAGQAGRHVAFVLPITCFVPVPAVAAVHSCYVPRLEASVDASC